MFTLVSDESSVKLGIGIHLGRTYEMATTFLNVRAAQDFTRKDFTAAVSPNYESLSEIKAGEEKKDVPNVGRWAQVTLGYYKDLDVIYDTVTALEEWYKTVLSRYGAEYRVLVEQGNSYHFVRDEDARPTRLGDAIHEARLFQAFDMVRQDHDIDFMTVVGKIMPAFMQSIGLPGYSVSHDLTKDGFGKACFYLDELANFSFYEPLKKDGPCYMQRHSYRGHDSYYLTYEGEVTAETLKIGALEWLLGAVRERSNLPYQNIEAYLEDIPVTVGRIIERPKGRSQVLQSPEMVVRTSLTATPLPDNVVPLFGPR